MEHNPLPDRSVRELESTTQPVAGPWGPILTALRDSPPGSLGSNLPGKIRLIAVGNAVLPLLEVSCRQPAAWTCSILSRHVWASVAEVRQWGQPLWLAIVMLQSFLFAKLLACLQVERTVLVNNWLLPTNPTPDLSAVELALLKQWLIAAYPDRALVMPSVNPALEPELAAGLRRLGARLVPLRNVHILDPRGDRYQRSSDVRRDRRLLKSTTYRTVDRDGGQWLNPDRLVTLYHDLYIKKYGILNAAFSRRYLEALLNSPAVEWVAYANPDRGSIDMFTLWPTGSRYLTKLMGAYDRTQPQKSGLFRMQIMHPVVQVAEQAGLPINLSSGSGPFKRMRGATQAIEYDAVWDAHLPPWRRMAWRILERKSSWAHREQLHAEPRRKD